MAGYAPLNHPVPASWVVSPLSPTSGYQKLDSHLDPFSDDYPSIPSSPVSITVSNSTVEEESQPSSEPDVPPFAASIQCCRCDEQQSLFSEWDKASSKHTASCVTCTSAFCRKCVISSESIIQFDSKCKATIPAEVFDVSCHWFCNTCGSLYDVPVSQLRRKNGVASIEFKSLACTPCNQKATSMSLFFASLPKSTASSDLPIPPPLNTAFSDGFFRQPTWNTSPVEPRRSWSLKSLRRWTSISSFRQYRPSTS
jgi:hypothetical protein